MKKVSHQNKAPFLLVAIPSGVQVHEEARVALIQNYPWVKDWDFEANIGGGCESSTEIRGACESNTSDFLLVRTEMTHPESAKF